MQRVHFDILSRRDTHLQTGWLMHLTVRGISPLTLKKSCSQEHRVHGALRLQVDISMLPTSHDSF